MAMCFNQPGLGLASANTKLFATTNGGVNWTPVSIPGTQIIGGLAGYSLKWFATRGKDIYYSTNQGSSWILQYSAPGTSTYSEIAASRIAAGYTIAFYAIRYNGGISKLFTATGINKVGEEVPSKFDLAQNYPNPFNSSTKIKFTIPYNSKVSLKVYNILGKLVDDLVDKYMAPGTYMTVFSSSALPSGTYFYRMSSNGLTLVKKMLLLK